MMKNFNDNFFKNQDIVFQIPGKNFRGFVSDIEDDTVSFILYASFISEKQIIEFREDKDRADEDIKEIKNSKEYFLIYQDINHAFVFRPIIKTISLSGSNIFIKANISELSSKREGREFLRVPALLQFIYEEISIDEFIENKEAYIAHPSFTTSVYGLYNINAPKIYQSNSDMKCYGDESQSVNPRLESLLVAINSKLDIVLSFLNPEASIFANIKEKKVSISGSGLMFSAYSDDSDFEKEKLLKPGSIIKMTLLFPAIPQFVVRVISQIVKVDKADGNKYDIACKFIAINESDRDEVVKFTFEVQRKQIKKPLA